MATPNGNNQDGHYCQIKPISESRRTVVMHHVLAPERPSYLTEA